MNIQLISSDAEREACARILSTSEPWLTLGYTYEEQWQRVSATDREIYVLKAGDEVVGLAIVAMQGVLAGYLQTIAVAEKFRGQGIGTQLLRFVEARIFRERPNVFLFVSSFNHSARNLYESLGYEAIGNVRDFLVKGYDEILMRKTIGPLRTDTRGPS